MSKNEIVDLIVARLQSEKSRAADMFSASADKVGVRHCYIENLLPESLAKEIYRAFPKMEQMRLMSSFRERKFTSKHFDQFSPTLKDITFALQDVAVVKVIEEITGIAQQIPDPTLYADGLSMMGERHFLNPHIDNSHEATRQFYRTLNLLFYVMPNWALQNGGNLEPWESSVRKNETVHSKFNRLVLMETTPTSWHSVSPVQVDQLRCCVSNYHFSPASPTGEQYFNVTSFSARPEQTARRVLAWADNKLCQGIRALVTGGVGPKDVYMTGGK